MITFQRVGTAKFNMRSSFDIYHQAGDKLQNNMDAMIIQNICLDWYLI